MGGSVSTGSETTDRRQSTTPWAPGAPVVQSLLSQLNGQPIGLTGQESGALNQLSALGANGNPFAGGISGVANNLLSGGGANNQAGMIGNAYQQYKQQLNPYLQSSFLDPRNAPGFGDALSALNSDITNQVNGQFAAAGRDMSGANQQALARGLSQGEGQLIANQYNQNVANQLGAMQSAYGAGNTTGGLLTGLNQTALGNMQAGIGAADAANQASQYGPLLQLQAAAAQRGIPLQQLTQEMGLAMAPTQAFGTTTGQGTTTQQSPLWQQIAGGATGLLGATGQAGMWGTGGTTASGGTVNPGILGRYFT